MHLCKFHIKPFDLCARADEMNAVYANETAHCLLYVCQFEMLAKETFAEAEIMKQLFKAKWKIKLDSTM